MMHKFLFIASIFPIFVARFDNMSRFSEPITPTLPEFLSLLRKTKQTDIHFILIQTS
jgi:hypothetical protein